MWIPIPRNTQQDQITQLAAHNEDITNTIIQSNNDQAPLDSNNYMGFDLIIQRNNFISHASAPWASKSFHYPLNPLCFQWSSYVLSLLAKNTTNRSSAAPLLLNMGRCQTFWQTRIGKSGYYFSVNVNCRPSYWAWMRRRLRRMISFNRLSGIASCTLVLF